VDHKLWVTVFYLSCFPYSSSHRLKCKACGYAFDLMPGQHPDALIQRLNETLSSAWFRLDRQPDGTTEVVCPNPACRSPLLFTGAIKGEGQCANCGATFLLENAEQVMVRTRCPECSALLFVEGGLSGAGECPKCMATFDLRNLTPEPSTNLD
jgi:DNA-directed RNA polymerase subunit RPC12/RpoP